MRVPASLLSPFGSYPNVLRLSDRHRELWFHPVLVFPEPPAIVDYTASPAAATGRATEPANSAALSSMLTPEEWEEIKRTMRPKAGGIPVSKSDDDGPVASDCVPDEGCSISHQPPPLSLLWTLGRYDENRVGMYESEMFQDTSKTIDGYAGRRTVHVGIDLGGPEGTPVHSFWHGVVHAVGYNPDLGDYGHVIVVRYSNGLRPEHADDDSDKNPASNNASASRVDSEHEKGEHFYALYGHLDSTVLRWRVGDAVRAGQVLAGLGSPGENGGWRVPHVHFQLSDSAPATHDMPGAVCVSDRDRALLEYPDPRYVLGPLY